MLINSNIISETLIYLQTIKTNLLIQHGPSAEFVTRPVEAFSQRVSSSPPLLAAVL